MRRLLALLLIILVGCGSNSSDIEHVTPEVNSVVYQIFVGSFRDSDGDGIGDLNGVREALDYIQYDLGASAIWLTPIHPSPTYHKYDVKDYKAIDEDFGTMEDFDALINEMTDRGMDLIMDLVLNHTSSQHPWFLTAVEAHKNGTCDVTPECNFYHFSDTPQANFYRIQEGLYYEGDFWSEMPDLNLDDPVLLDKIVDISQFWIDKGVKGYRLDATTHFFRENIELNTQFLGWFTDVVKGQRADAYLVGEAWTGQSIVNQMFASGMDSFFNFDFSQQSGTLVRSVQRGNGASLAQAVENHQSTIRSVNPNAIEAYFLSNHDNNRSAGYLSVNEDFQRMVASAYILFPGNVFVYYGEEIGMKGSGIDENKRLPMVWSVSDDTGIPNPPANATQQNNLEAGVAEQLKDANSLLRHYQRIIRIRNMHPELSREVVEAIDTGLSSVYATRQGNTVVLHNFSDEPQTVALEGIETVTLVGGSEKHSSDEITLEGWSSVVIRLAQ